VAAERRCNDANAESHGTALQFERMKASAGADVEDAPTAQIESQRFERINRLPQQKAAGTSSRAPS
jgi:hypothetical protein